MRKAGVKPSKWILPRERRLWAMLLVPYLLGVVVAGGNIWHLPAGLGLVAGMLAVNAVLERWRQPKPGKLPWLSITVYGGASILLLAWPLFLHGQAIWPLLVMAVLIWGHVFLVRRQAESHLTNEALAIVTFSMGLPLAVELGGGAEWRSTGLAAGLNIAYFLAGGLFAKAVLQERNNLRFHFIAMMYHLMLLLLPLLLQLPWPAVLLYLPGVVKMALVMGRRRMPARTLGWLENLNALWFLVGAILILG